MNRQSAQLAKTATEKENTDYCEEMSKTYISNTYEEILRNQMKNEVEVVKGD